MMKLWPLEDEEVKVTIISFMVGFGVRTCVVSKPTRRALGNWLVVDLGCH